MTYIGAQKMKRTRKMKHTGRRHCDFLIFRSRNPCLLAAFTLSSFFAVCESDAQGFAATVCLTYSISVVQTIAFKQHQFPLLQYAVRHWYMHVRMATYEKREGLEYNLVTKLFDFPSDTRFKKWLAVYEPAANNNVLPTQRVLR
jgi:hypothetical protein